MLLAAALLLLLLLLPLPPGAEAKPKKKTRRQQHSQGSSGGAVANQGLSKPPQLPEIDAVRETRLFSEPFSKLKRSDSSRQARDTRTGNVEIQRRFLQVVGLTPPPASSGVPAGYALGSRYEMGADGQVRKRPSPQCVN